MFNRLVASILLLPLVFLTQQTSADLCNLCEKGVEGINWPHHLVDQYGKTCTQKAIDMAFFDLGSSICHSEVAAHRNRCCGPTEPGPIQQAPTKPPTYNGPKGSYKKCSLCMDGDYPSETSMVITMLYVGSGSCAQFYDYAANGLIQTHLCEPLQYFAYEPCGCGEFNQNLMKEQQQQQHQQNNQAQQAPPLNNVETPMPTTTSPTTRPPSLRPTMQPTTRSPTQVPTPRPTTLAPIAKTTATPTPQPSLPPTPQPNDTTGQSSSSESSTSKSGGLQNQKTPKQDGKDSLKLGNKDKRGGAGGGRRRRRHRYLKGSS